MTITATEAPVLDPLSAAEREQLNAFLARDSASKGPSARIGEPYEALVCLSVPRRGDKDRMTDLVFPGETVYLTEEEARQFNRHDPGRDGRQVEVLRKLTGPGGTREPAPRLLPRHVSGRMFRPTTPAPGSDSARPDPAGSSTIQVLQQDGNAPEAAGSVAAEAQEMAANLSAIQQDAVDLPPTRQRQRTRGGQ